jgi:hypothetical protein
VGRGAGGVLWGGAACSSPVPAGWRRDGAGRRRAAAASVGASRRASLVSNPREIGPQISTGKDIQMAHEGNPREQHPWANDPGKRPGTR